MKWVWSQTQTKDGFTKVNLDRISSITISLDDDNIVVKAWAGEEEIILDKFPILNIGKDAIDSAYVRAKKYVDEITYEYLSRY